MLSREWNVSVCDLQELHRKSVSLLEMLKTHCLTELAGLNLKAATLKRHTAFCTKARDCYVGWSENTSCQGPEHAHIDIIKSVAHLTNNNFNKDVFFAFCAAVACCSSMNSCWKTWLGRVRHANFDWIELEWQRP